MATDRSINVHISNFPGGGIHQAARKNLMLVLVAAAALMVAWSFAVPVFEGPDEPAHWRYACYLNQNHALPTYGPNFVEANSPPLYYLLIAPLAVDARLPPVGFVGEEYGRRFLLFPPREYQNASGDFALYWPFRVARIVSVLISVFTVWFCALAGAEASGGPRTGLLVGGLVAFWPMFTFRAMNVSNDALVTMFSALALYLIVRMIKRGFRWGIGIFAALAVAGAFLSKTSAIILPAPFLLAIISERGSWRAKVTRAGALGAIMLMTVGPWLIRNQHLYGDLLAQRAMSTAVSGLVQRHSLGSGYFRTYFPLTLIMSFIGNFGWMTVQLPVLAYVVYTIAFVCAGACWIVGVQQRRIDLRLSAILSNIIVLNLMVVVYINLTFTQAQGRYMLPALPAIALLLGLGLDSLRSWSQYRTMLTLGGLAASNLTMLVCLVIPAYWPPVIIM
jgi:4-amino-4-deoxy-L-arabinose transferase-like glycosyltransferase